MTYIHRVFKIFMVLLVAGYCTDSAIAQSVDTPEANAQVNNEPQWGTQDAIEHWLQPIKFVPQNPDNASYHFNSGSLVKDGGTNQYFIAPIDLPNGVWLEGMRFFYCDTNAADNLTFYLTYNVAGAEGSIAYGTTAGQPSGCGNIYLAVNTTIDLKTATADQYYQAYVKIPFTLSHEFRGIKLYYKLQVSPAPGTAHFADVPTSHVFFQFIEALAASGISAGCTATQYCPDSYVTRGQMAVFLSKALGLHWPNP